MSIIDPNAVKVCFTCRFFVPGDREGFGFCRNKYTQVKPRHIRGNGAIERAKGTPDVIHLDGLNWCQNWTHAQDKENDEEFDGDGER